MSDRTYTLDVTAAERHVLLGLIDWYRRQNDPEEQMDMTLFRCEFAKDQELIGLRSKAERAREVGRG